MFAIWYIVLCYICFLCTSFVQTALCIRRARRIERLALALWQRITLHSALSNCLHRYSCLRLKVPPWHSIKRTDISSDRVKTILSRWQRISTWIYYFTNSTVLASFRTMSANRMNGGFACTRCAGCLLRAVCASASRSSAAGQNELNVLRVRIELALWWPVCL